MPWILSVFCHGLCTQYIATMAHFVMLFFINVQWGDFFVTFFFNNNFQVRVFSPNLMFTIIFNMWMFGSNKWTLNCKWNSKMMIVKTVLLAFLLIKKGRPLNFMAKINMVYIGLGECWMWKEKGAGWVELQILQLLFWCTCVWWQILQMSM